MALDWLPIFPSGVEGDPGLGAAFQPYYASSSFPVPSTWRPIAPDWIPRKPGLLTAQQAAYTGNIRPIATLPTVALSWQGSYPNQTFRSKAGLSGALAPSLFAVLTSAVPPPALSWKAVYPDWFPRRLPVQRQASETFIATIRIAPLGSWQPSYPEFTRRTILPAGDVPFLAFITPSPWPIPNDSWQGRYPDRISAAFRLNPAAQQAFAQNLLPIKNAPPNLAGLIPTYPDRVLPRVSVRAGSQRTFTLNLVPIPNPPAPTFSWQAISPSWNPLPPAAWTARMAYTAPVSAAAQVAFPLAWVGQQTTRVRRAFPPLWIATPTAPPSLVTLGATQGWRPSHPDWLRGASTRPGASATVISPLVVHDPDCIEITGDTLTYATMTEEGLSQPTITDSALTLPDLTAEGVC